MSTADLFSWSKDSTGGYLPFRVAATKPLAVAVLGTMTTICSTPGALANVERYLRQGTTVSIESHSLRPLVAGARAAVSTPERIRDTLRYLGVAKTQLADACRVSRQTLYDWLEGRFEPEAGNAERLEAIHSLAIVARDAGAPLSAKLVQRQLTSGRTFAEMLADERPSYEELRGVVSALASSTAARKGQSAQAVLERLGGKMPPRDDQDATLDENLRDLD